MTWRLLGSFLRLSWPLLSAQGASRPLRCDVRSFVGACFQCFGLSTRHFLLKNQWHFWTLFLIFHWKKHTISMDFHWFSQNPLVFRVVVLRDQASDPTKSKCFVKYGRCTLSRYAVLRVFHNVFASTRRHKHAYKTGISYARSHDWSNPNYVIIISLRKKIVARLFFNTKTLFAGLVLVKCCRD